VVLTSMTNNNAVKRIYLLLLMILILIIASGCNRGADSSNRLPVEEVQINGVLFKLELALSPDQRAAGLMGRDRIAADGGMLFVFPDQPPYPTELGFWMKNCLVPIDLLFLDPDGQVVAIHEMDLPLPGIPDHELLVYQSGVPAQYAIELKGGRAAELGVTVGDLIELRFTELLEMAQ